ncbi:MAG TPA: hypothetical protein VLV49_11370, partial [Terriglobales bacterium]|nr:hypothetical protein [Terriglobales bacterium]
LGRPTPMTRQRFWVVKLLRNKQRDKINRQRLRRDNWDVLVVWECQTRDAKSMSRKLKSFLETR